MFLHVLMSVCCCVFYACVYEGVYFCAPVRGSVCVYICV